MAKEILSKNLKNLLEHKGKTQTDMAKDLDLKESTVSSWLNAVKYPRRDKIELLADYFGVMPSDITEDKSIKQDTIAAHLDDDFTEEELQKIRDFAELVRQARKKD
ncbi:MULTISPECIES: helix-turn-helix domain-containing protein [Bacillati]|uniref:helix-turn-helix domain-containing protein n=1 Tax=Bacillati TaxID=1783272 RepID=UPI0011A557E7|nr:helix-turn-helix transcriptional regulator [Staphylococcus epidermidis]MDH8783408.1 helix-turn-helix transcriptional regulator [Staphylococcus epidermidis]MDH8930335.1 helix-turn-helix transcriptional regulator [Staphylococcus epidermidis]